MAFCKFAVLTSLMAELYVIPERPPSLVSFFSSPRSFVDHIPIELGLLLHALVLLQYSRRHRCSITGLYSCKSQDN
jgi:hypothetical protein